MKISAMADTSDLTSRLSAFASVVGAETSQAVKQFARKACIYLAVETQPFGKDASAQAKGETAVASDIYKVYLPATGYKFNKMARQINDNYNAKRGKASPDASSKFQDRLTRYQIENNTGALTRIAASMKFRDVALDTFDRQRHRDRRGPRGTVRPGKQQLVIGAEEELEKYVEYTQKKVGLTKAGWAKCAELIKLNRVSSSTRELPAWITRNMYRATGIVVDLSDHKENPKVHMTNTTPWTSNVLSPSAAKSALDLARKNFIEYMNTTIKKTLRNQVKLKGA
jgi:hypothetical protein